MKFNLYKLDYVDGAFAPTLMGSYESEAVAEAAQREFQKTHLASWMISSNQPKPFIDGQPISLANL